MVGHGAEVRLNNVEGWSRELPAHSRDIWFDTLTNAFDPEAVIHFMMPNRCHPDRAKLRISTTQCFEAAGIPADWVWRSEALPPRRSAHRVLSRGMGAKRGGGVASTRLSARRRGRILLANRGTPRVVVAGRASGIFVHDTFSQYRRTTTAQEPHRPSAHMDTCDAGGGRCRAHSENALQRPACFDLFRGADLADIPASRDWAFLLPRLRR